jgi:LemA protein
MPLMYILGIVAVGLLVYVVATYNSLASMRARIRAAIQEIGNQLKRQAELIPNLEQSVKGYLAHEKDIIKMLADARKMVAAGADPSAKIAEVLPRLQIVVESNPQIKGSDIVSRLMDELRDTSDKVMYSRRTLIDLSADYNIALVTVPSKFVADIFGFKPEKGFETPESGAHMSVSEAETKTPKISI